MLLAKRHELNLNDCLTDTIPGTSDTYLPDNQSYNIPFKNQISIRQLLEHRAGVFDLTNFPVPDTCMAMYAGHNYLEFVESIFPSHNFTLDEIFGVIARYHLCDFSPDSAFHYSNTGYMLLGKIIERVSGQSYSDFINGQILTPNQLTQTSFPLSTVSILPDPYIPAKVQSGFDLITIRKQNMSYEFAQGNCVTTAGNLVSWLKKWQGGHAGLPFSVVQQMRNGSGQNEDYGFGTSFVPGMGYGHTGAIAGYLSFMFYDPEADFTMLLICNLWNMKTQDSFYEQVSKLSEIYVNAKQICTESAKTTTPETIKLYDLLKQEIKKTLVGS